MSVSLGFNTRYLQLALLYPGCTHFDVTYKKLRILKKKQVDLYATCKTIIKSVTV